MPLPIVQVDAFTSKPFAGNPAAVCVLPSARDAVWMQDVAREMNLSETAFLERQADGFNLRWFTPSVEVDLCGHATLASAHVLWEAGHLKPGEQARFHTRSGLLTADKQGDWIEMDFPVKAEEPAEPPARLGEALGTAMKYVGRNKFD
jgi:PhzF family phenazine biosynthesis protein